MFIAILVIIALIVVAFLAIDAIMAYGIGSGAVDMWTTEFFAKVFRR